MMKTHNRTALIVLIGGIFLLYSASAIAAPTSVQTRTLVPDLDSTRDVGSSSLRYANGFFDSVDATTFVASGLAPDLLVTTDSSNALVSSSTPTMAGFSATSTTATSTIAGHLSIGTSTPHQNASLNIEIDNVGAHGIKITGALGQDEHLFSVENNLGRELVSIGDDGDVTLDHIAEQRGEDALHIDNDINGFADVSSIDMIHTLTGLGAEETASAIIVTFDSANSASGSTAEALDVFKIGSGSVEIGALGCHAGVNCIHQDVGLPVNMTLGLKSESGVISTTTTEFNSSASDVTIWTNDNDVIYVGHTVQFSQINIEFAVTSGKNIKPVFEHSNGSGGFVAFEPIDTTNGGQENGVVSYELDNIGDDWGTDPVNGSADLFFIRITRTRNVIMDTATEDILQIIVATEFSWDLDGNVDMNRLIVTSLVDADHFVATSSTATSTFAGGFTLETTGFIYDFSSNNVFIGDGGGMVIGHGSQIDFGATPEFQILGTSISDSSMGFGLFANNALGADFRFLKSRGATPGLNVLVVDGDRLGRIRFQGADGNDFNTTAAEFEVEVDGTASLNNVFGRFVWNTRSSGGLNEKMRLDSVGNLGIGDTSPTFLLDVAGEGRFTGLVDASHFIATSTTADTNLHNNLFVIDSSASRIGFGTTSPDFVWHFTTDISGNSMLLESTSGASEGPAFVFRHSSLSPATNDAIGAFQFTGRDSGGASEIYADMTAVIIDPTAGSEDGGYIFSIQMAGSSVNAFRSNPTETVFNDSGESINFRVESDADTHAIFMRASDGNVGIGTSSPYATFSIEQQSGDTPTFVVSDEGTSTPHLFINGQGRVGLGTNSPDATLDLSGSGIIAFVVQSDDNRAQFNMRNNVANPAADTETGRIVFQGKDDGGGLNNYGTLAVFVEDDTNGSEKGYFVFSTAQSGAAAEVMRLDFSGNVGIGTTTPGFLLAVERSGDGDVAGFTDSSGTCSINPTSTALICTSDKRLKKNVEQLGSSLEKILQLNPVRYSWLKEITLEPEHTGFIAQELQKVYPELVHERYDGFLATDETGLIPELVKAIQELEARIQQLENEEVIQCNY